jgi:hypothetical protein
MSPSNFDVFSPRFNSMAKVNAGWGVNLSHLYGLINLMWTPQPALTFAIELNLGEKTSKFEGDITLGDDPDNDPHVASLEKSRSAQRISFGLFFDF